MSFEIIVISHPRREEEVDVNKTGRWPQPWAAALYMQHTTYDKYTSHFTNDSCTSALNYTCKYTYDSKMAGLNQAS